MHWDHEPVWAIQSAAGPAHSKTWRKCARLSPTRQRLGVRRSSAALLVDEALDKLEAQDPDKARLVKLRFFTGLTNEEAAASLGISPTTAKRYWTFARAWLYSEITSAIKGSAPQQRPEGTPSAF